MLSCCFLHLMSVVLFLILMEIHWCWFKFKYKIIFIFIYTFNLPWFQYQFNIHIYLLFKSQVHCQGTLLVKITASEFKWAEQDAGNTEKHIGILYLENCYWKKHTGTCIDWEGTEISWDLYYFSAGIEEKFGQDF